MLNSTVVSRGLFAFTVVTAISLSSGLYAGSSADMLTAPRSSLTESDLLEIERMNATEHECARRKSETLSCMRESASPFTYISPSQNMYEYDVLHYKIDIKIDMEGHSIDGYVEVSAMSLIDGLSYLDLNLTTDLSISSIKLDGVSQTHSHSTELLTIFLTEPFDSGQEFVLRIEYDGMPTPEAYGIWFHTYDGRDVCATFCQPYGARNWWPCKDYPFDKPDSIDIVLTYPESHGGYPMLSASNGLLDESYSNGDGTITDHWKHGYSTATYLVAFTITEFTVTEQSWEYSPGESLPIRHYAFPGIDPSDTLHTTYYMVNYTVPALEACSHYWGPYPFEGEKYGHMNNEFGGMEHQTCTTLGPDFEARRVIIHEVAHQWAGDHITCETFHDMWLNEGFATYAEILYWEYEYGWPVAFDRLWDIRYMDVGSPYVEDLALDNIFDGPTVYYKGAWLVHMLRHQMGDSLFFPAMQYYFHDSEFAGGTATTDDLNSVLSQFYGSDLSWFFDAWVHQENQPNYRYFYDTVPDTVSGQGYRLLLFLEQIHDQNLFPMHIEIVSFSGELDTTYRVWNDSQCDVYEFNSNWIPDSVIVDPRHKILRSTVKSTPRMRIVSGNLPNAVVGEPYSFMLEAMWGVPSYQWEKILGQIPYGFTLDEETGVLSGTPTFVAEQFFRLRCTDSDSPPNVDERGYTFKIVEPLSVRGDCDNSGGIDIDDAVFLIAYIFSGGPSPDPIAVGDVDCSDGVDIDDIVYLIDYIFTGGDAPCD